MKPDNRYISFLDGFRGYAILFVLFGHWAFVRMAFAQFGVTVFFFVSGFLITKLLIEEYHKKNTINIKDFYLRRFFRLYPALIFMIIVYCIVVLVNGYRIIWDDIIAGLFYYTNYYYNYFNSLPPDSRYLTVSGVLWSLSVEEHFYLLFPLFFLFLFSKRKVFLWINCFLLLFFLLVRLLSKEHDFYVIYRNTHCRADSILYGCVSALLIYEFKSKKYLQLLRSKVALYLGVVFLLFAIFYRNGFFHRTFEFSIVGIGLFLFIPSFLFINPKSLVNKIVDNKLTVYTGKLSYSLYLFHWVVIQMANFRFAEKWYFDANYKLFQMTFGWYLFVIPLTIVLALASYFFVEKPFITLRRKFGSHAR